MHDRTIKITLEKKKNVEKKDQGHHEKISVIVRRRSLALARASVCTPPPPRAVDVAAAAAAVEVGFEGCAGASNDRWDFEPSVRLPRPSVNRDCVGGRSVSEPERVAHGDDPPALSGVTGVRPADSGGASLDDGRCRCRPLRALTLTVSGRLNVTVFDRACRLEPDASALEDVDADVDDWPESVRETGNVVTAVVGAALGVVMVMPGLALVLPRAVTVGAPDVFRRVNDVDLSVWACCSAAARDSDGRAGSGGGMVS